MELCNETINAFKEGSEMRFFLHTSRDAFENGLNFQAVKTFVDETLKEKLMKAGLRGTTRLLAVQLWGKRVYAVFDANNETYNREIADKIANPISPVFHIHCKGATIRITKDKSIAEFVNQEVAKAYQLNPSVAPPYYSDHSPEADPLKYRWHSPTGGI